MGFWSSIFGHKKQSILLLDISSASVGGALIDNSNGDFNVPHGKYSNPKICDSENIYEVSKVLKDTKIIYGDFSECKKFSLSGSLVYFDPPYRPLNTTSSFTAYSRNGFCNSEQIRLANLCKELTQKGIYVLLSNSDPTNENTDDKFFDDIYSDFKIKRVLANRMVNCNSDKRGQIKELLIANY